MNYAIDTYGDLTGDLWKWQIEGNGRFITALFFYIARRIPLHYNYIYTASYLFSILCLAAASYFLYTRLSRKLGSDSKLLLLISGLSVSNYLSVNYFLWYEGGLYNFAVLLNVCAVLQFDNLMTASRRQDKIKHYLLALIMLLCCVMIYQASISFFIVLSLPFILLENRNIKTFFVNNAIVLSLYAMPSAFSLFLLKVIIKSRRVGAVDSTVSERLITVTENIFRIAVSGGNTFFPWIAMAFVVIMSLLAVARSHNGRDKFVIIVSIIYICVFGAVIVFAPYYLGSTADYTDRIYLPFASIPGAVAIYLSGKTNIQDWSENVKKFGLIFMGVLFLAQFYRNTQVFVERYKVNQTDRYLAMTIQDRIQRYELSSGNKVDTICIYYDAGGREAYDNLDKYEASASAFDERWSDVELINYVNGTDYIRGEQSDKYAEYFSSIEWKSYSDEQLIFDGTTLHLCIY